MDFGEVEKSGTQYLKTTIRKTQLESGEYAKIGSALAKQAKGNTQPHGRFVNDFAGVLGPTLIS